MDLEDNDFLDFAKNAENFGLKYIIIGGFAMYLNGIKRNTEDVDIWLEPTNENKEKLIEVFIKLGYNQSDLHEISAHDFTTYFVFSALGYLDFLTQIHPNLDFKFCFEQSQIHELSNQSICRFLHINQLRESKILARRDLDYRDVILIDDYLKQNPNG
ncbi:MAG: hypothetical protein EAZ53_03590 [Bacteroidetes bacterium]|nr:MAG: hypothetical protein EAZ53_03590 [Bacteroidota bacterium]